MEIACYDNILGEILIEIACYNNIPMEITCYNNIPIVLPPGHVAKLPSGELSWWRCWSNELAVEMAQWQVMRWRLNVLADFLKSHGVHTP